MAKGGEEVPASVVVQTPLGKIDINNVSGAAKRRLIMEGKVSPDKFVTPDNMPGKKLAAMRAKNKTNLGIGDVGQFKVGELVEFRKKVSQIVEVNPKKGVKISKGKGEVSKWIPFNRIKPVTPDEED